MKHIISLGAGVQSSTLALMAAVGEITPMPDAAIFADTGAEPKRVYDYLDWLEGQLPFPVYRVMHKEGLLSSIMKSGNTGRFVSVPFFIKSSKKAAGGMGRRQCTQEFKIRPVEAKIRELVGMVPYQRGPKRILATLYMGISTDEASRMKPARRRWIQARWPLIEKEMSRDDCLAWMQAHGYPKPRKSSCTFCPYHDEKTWVDMKRHDKESFAQAVMVDRHIRSGMARVAQGLEGQIYLHRSRTPLEGVVFSDEVEESPQLSLFNEECSGMCGV